MANKYPIIVRMDDICETMDYDKFCRYRKLFDELKVKPLYGLVPANKDPHLMKGHVEQYWELIHSLIENGGAIAMHGYEHVYHTHQGGLVANTPDSEFSGLSLDEQREIICKGKQILSDHGVSTNVFMAPSHTYDRNTLTALRENGFRYLTDGTSFHPYMEDCLHCIPADSAWHWHRFGILTICIHSNEDTEQDYQRLEAFLRKNILNVISFGEACCLPMVSHRKAMIESRIRACYRNIGYHVYGTLKR